MKMNKRLKRILIGIGIITVLVGILVGVGWYIFAGAIAGFGEYLASEGGCLGGRPYQRQAIEERGNFQFPPSAENISAYTYGFQDCEIYVRFEMASSELDFFIKSTHVTEPLELTDHPSAFDRVPRLHLDWEFPRNKVYLYGTEGEPGIGQWIAIDTTNSDRFVVYIITLLL